MKANELMIGDLVFGPDNSVLKMASIASNGIYFDSKEGEGVCTLDMISPIPLTAEILEKNGFEKKERWWYLKEKEKTIFMMMNKSDGTFRFSVSLNVQTIQSVHQLQHAFRLGGIDKEIEL